MIVAATLAVLLTAADLWLTRKCLAYPRAFERNPIYRALGFEGTVLVSVALLAVCGLIAREYGPGVLWAYAIPRAAIVALNVRTLRRLRSLWGDS